MQKVQIDIKTTKGDRKIRIASHYVKTSGKLTNHGNAFVRGVVARIDSKLVSTCPYRSSSMQERGYRGAWMSGYNSSQREMEFSHGLLDNCTYTLKMPNWDAPWDLQQHDAHSVTTEIGRLYVMRLHADGETPKFQYGIDSAYEDDEETGRAESYCEAIEQADRLFVKRVRKLLTIKHID